REHVPVPDQNAVERARISHKAFTRGDLDQVFDDGVDDGILDARPVARSLFIGRLRAPDVALLIAGRAALAGAAENDVEIEVSQAIYELRVIDRTESPLDAEAIQIAQPRTDQLFERWLELKNSNSNFSPVFAFVKTPSLTCQPAAVSK